MKIVKLYEFSFWLNPELKDEEAANYFQKIKGFVAEFSGEITKEQSIQKKKLAYPIEKAKQGYFGFMLFNMDPANIKSLDKKLKLETNILRYLTIAVDKNHLSQMKRQEEEIKEKFQKIIRPGEDTGKKPRKTEDKIKLEEEIEKKLEAILEKTS